MTGREAVTAVARREFTERLREKSFLISTGVNVGIIVALVVLAAVLGGDETRYAVGYAGAAEQAVVEAAASGPVAVDPERVQGDVRAALDDGSLDAAVADGAILAAEDPPDELVAVLQAASAQARGAAALERAGVAPGVAREALAPEALPVRTTEAADEDADATAGFTFLIVLVLYGQLLTYGYWVATGVVEEKASRVVEVVLATIRPGHLLAGKVIGLGLLGLGNLLLITVVGLGAAAATGALDVDGAILGAAGLALAWFVVGYAFYASAFAAAGALVPRQEEIQSSVTPLVLLILVSFVLAFTVLESPDGTLAHVTAFIPMTAPMTVPPRVATGDVPGWELAASFLVTAGGAALLVPLAARIYAGGVLRTGAALKLREAWRAARG